jgi:RimJ/RimL family protein N-acetyltransferase
MEPAIPHFARVRVASRDAISVRRGDVVVACDPYGRCSLRRVTWLGNDHVRIKADARIGGEELVPRAALLGICDLVDVGGEGQSIESRPQGALRVLGAIIRRRRLTVSQTERRMYVYDFGGSRIANVDSPVHFAELTLDEIHERWESLRAGGEAIPFTTGGQNGCVVGTLGGRQVYHAWYLRIDGSRLQAAPNDWRPRGTVLFLHGMYTEPAFRGRGIHTAAFRWLLARDESANTAHAIAVVNEDNVPARRAVEVVGFRFVGRVR